LTQFTNRERTALVWGARGFIGRALVTHLHTAGWQVRTLTRSLSGERPWPADVSCVELPGHDRLRAFSRALDGVSVVFNLAGSSGAVTSNLHPIDSLESNCRVQLEFLAACERTGPLHVVFASTRLVYAPSGLTAVDESAAVGPKSVYAAHKLCVEHYHQIASQRRGISYTICRISNPYGADPAASHKDYGFVNAMMHRAGAGQAITLFGDGQQLRDYIHIDDLTTMLRLCAERRPARNAVLNIGSGSSISIRDAAAEIQRAFDGGPIEFRSWPDDHDAVESGHFVMDISRARAVLEYSPQHDFRSGIQSVKGSRLPAFESASATTAATASGGNIPSFV
jgi:UDP-glucose 4-epimerase